MKKHSHQEILLKLNQAAELVRAGKSQAEVCKALGVSVMTFHRWRKLPGVAEAKAVAASDEAASAVPPPDMANLLDELTNENRRLRKIVTDLLLEKMKQEEAIAAMPPIAAPKKTIADGV